jgi:hypothetical protein
MDRSSLPPQSTKVYLLGNLNLPYFEQLIAAGIGLEFWRMKCVTARWGSTCAELAKVGKDTSVWA